MYNRHLRYNWHLKYYTVVLYTPCHIRFEMSLCRLEPSPLLKGAILCCLKSILGSPKSTNKSNKAILEYPREKFTGLCVGIVEQTIYRIIVTAQTKSHSNQQNLLKTVFNKSHLFKEWFHCRYERQIVRKLIIFHPFFSNEPNLVFRYISITTTLTGNASDFRSLDFGALRIPINTKISYWQ